MIDLHTHTRFGSNCSYMYPWELARQARQIGLAAVCITEHDLPWRPEDLAKLSGEYDILVLGGMEVATDLGQFLVFGIRDSVVQVSRAQELCRLVDEGGGVMVTAHPMRTGWNLPTLEEALSKPCLHLVRVAEVFNGFYSAKEMELSCQVFQRLGLKGVGGSDSHAQHTVGQCVTVFNAPVRNEVDLVAQLREGTFHAWHRSSGRVF